MVEEIFAGTWQQVSCNEDGVVIPESKETFVSFDGNEFAVSLSDGTVLIKGTYAIDSRRNPKVVDWTDTFGADAGKTFPAIYTLSDNSFAFCAADEGMDRPTGFDAIRGHTIRVFKRAYVPD